MEIRSWRIRSAGVEGFWLFWDPRVETVSLVEGEQPEDLGTVPAVKSREGSEAEAGRGVSPNETLAECEDPLQFDMEV